MNTELMSSPTPCPEVGGRRFNTAPYITPSPPYHVYTDRMGANSTSQEPPQGSVRSLRKKEGREEWKIQVCDIERVSQD